MEALPNLALCSPPERDECFCIFFLQLLAESTTVAYIRFFPPISLADGH